VHGGNRLGANSLLDTLIFGRRAGEHAGGLAHDRPMPTTRGSRVDDTARYIRSIMARPDSGRRISEIKQELGETMNRYAAVFRDENGLLTAHEIIRRLREEAKTAPVDDHGTIFNQDVVSAFELDYMIDSAEAIVVSAMERKESRGAQSRTDYPDRNDDEWLKHIDISVNGDDVPTVSYSPVTITKWQPQVRSY
jgi:succinate dehydrogenase / fumarate reductase flavoprotein subunit